MPSVYETAEFPSELRATNTIASFVTPRYERIYDFIKGSMILFD